MEIMKRRGARRAAPKGAAKRRRAPGAAAAGFQPLQVFAEGDSWFDYPPFLFKGGIIPRLESRLGVPILNLAKAGDEVRFMLGVEQRMRLAECLTEGCPAGGPWDVLLFSGGGNDIVDNPMALWIRDWDPNVPPAAQDFTAALTRATNAPASIDATTPLKVITMRVIVDRWSPGQTVPAAPEGLR